MGASGRQFVRVGPEIVDPGDPSCFVQLEEAQPGLPALGTGELDPADGLRAIAEDPFDLEMPGAGEALDVEPDVGRAPAHPLPGLRGLVDDIVGEQRTESAPIARFRRSPVRLGDRTCIRHGEPPSPSMRGQWTSRSPHSHAWPTATPRAPWTADRSRYDRSMSNERLASQAEADGDHGD